MEAVTVILDKKDLLVSFLKAAADPPGFTEGASTHYSTKVCQKLHETQENWTGGIVSVTEKFWGFSLWATINPVLDLVMSAYVSKPG